MSRHLRVDVLLIGLAVLVLAAAAATVVSAGVIENTPPYIHQCSRLDPKLLECYVDAIMHIRPWLAKGIPEASVPPSEPFRLAELSLSLTRGPGGYSVHLRDIDVSGISNFTVRHLTVGSNFVLEVAVAELTMVADYSSSGVLILIPASGRGVLHGVLKGVRVVLAGSASVQRRGAHEYVHLDKMVVDIKVRNPQLRIDRAPGQNSVVATATNLLLKTNSHLVLNAMLPELRVKLAEVFLDIANNIFEKIPVSLMVRDW